MKALFALLLSAATIVAVAAPPAAGKPKPAPAPAPEPKTEMRVVEPVAYDQLKDKIGQEIVVITTLGTHRRGTLVKISNSAVILKLDAKAGGIELDIPRNTVRSLELVSQPLPPGDDSAKKN